VGDVDRDEDLLSKLLYLNQSQADGIQEVMEAAAYGLDDPGYATQAAFSDSDGDGDLDMNLMNVDMPRYRFLMHIQEVQTPLETDKLFSADGKRFVDVSSGASLIDPILGSGLGLSMGDLNHDRPPDNAGTPGDGLRVVVPALPTRKPQEQPLPEEPARGRRNPSGR